MPASSTKPRRTRPPRSQAEPAADAPAAAQTPWYQTTWFLALASSLALWLALAPVGWYWVAELGQWFGRLWSPLAVAARFLTWLAPLLASVTPLVAWLAPLGWLLLIRTEKLSGRWPHMMLWLAGFAHWLLVMEGVRRAYWALYFGWIALAAYLAVYLLLFVGISRIAVHRWRVPLVIAAPTVWVGLELARGYLLTGFSMALLGHTQAEWTPLIQVADLAGAYAVSFVVMFVAAGIAQSLPWNGQAWRFRPLVAATGMLAVVLGYGYYRLAEDRRLQAADAAEPLKVVLVQNSEDTVFGVPMEKFEQTFRAYARQAIAAAGQHPDADVMIWPESSFLSLYPHYLLDDDAPVPDDAPLSQAEFHRLIGRLQQNFDLHARSTAQAINGRTDNGQPRRQIAQVVGTATYHFRDDGEQRYNAALLLSPTGEVAGQYFKQHPVMFGEYIPFGDVAPWIYRLTPMHSGLTRGERAETFAVAGYRLSPSICFESTVPHLIRRQVRELESRGERPDMLVNVTNDGWFWGSGVLDLHYSCAVFRAVEHRLPMLVAANTGLSVAVAGSGRVLAKGPRREVETLVVEVKADRRTSLYTLIGDLPAGICLALTIALAVSGFSHRWRRKRA